MEVTLVWPVDVVAKKQPGRSKEDIQLEKKQQLEKRLQDVKGVLNPGTTPSKKTPKKGRTEQEMTSCLIICIQFVVEAPCANCTYKCNVPCLCRRKVSHGWEWCTSSAEC